MVVVTGSIEDLVRQEWLAQLERRTAADDDNFFTEGGTSLQAAAMMAALSRTTGRRLRMRLLIANPTLARLTRAVATELSIHQDRGTS